MMKKYKKIIENGSCYLTRFCSETFGDMVSYELLCYAAELGKDIYLLLENGHSIPTCLDGHEIKMIEWFDGPIGSESYKAAEKRITEELEKKYKEIFTLDPDETPDVLDS
jgi:hypothetical protein